MSRSIPAYPTERVEFMLADSGVAVVVTERRASLRTLDGERANLVCLDRDAGTTASSDGP